MTLIGTLVSDILLAWLILELVSVKEMSNMTAENGSLCLIRIRSDQAAIRAERQTHRVEVAHSGN